MGKISKYFVLAGLILISINLCGQTVYSTDYENQADINVFVVEYEAKADLKVYRLEHIRSNSKNNGLWFFTEHSNKAEKKIFFVDYESKADLIICFVDYPNRAGWINKSKKHIMY